MRRFEVVREDMRRTSGDVTLPTRATAHSIAYDFYANDNYKVLPNQVAKIWTDVKAKMEEDDALLINIRSSMGGKFALSNQQGWVESDYYENESNDGNLGIFLKNVTDEVQFIKVGDRIGQGMFVKYLITDDDNAQGIRVGGFGSTN